MSTVAIIIVTAVVAGVVGAFIGIGIIASSIMKGWR